MSKGSRLRKIINTKQFSENWDKIFGRKKIPKHGATQLHADKTKKIPREDKHNDIDLDGIYWDSDFEEQSKELYGDNMPDIKGYPDVDNVD
ncbi:hypothetical protein [uncultured virus]|uniref:Uncharacterized protein n=1 Tax=uncultured virus TaxID=340016 RepID=A0A218MLY5_9VIRU|nr:hypothetical protein [uncultured virus]